MIYERLVIRHFGPVKEIDIRIYPLTVFIGTQGSGKSTVSKVLTICNDMNWIMSLLNGGDQKVPFVKFCIDEYFYDDSFIEYEVQNSFGHYIIQYKEGKFDVEVKDGSKDLLSQSIQSFIFSANQVLLSQLGVTDFSDIDVLKKYRDIINSNSRTILYVPAERNLAGVMSTSLASMLTAKVPLYDALVEYMSVFEKAKHEFKTYQVPFLKSTFTLVDGKERIQLTDSVDGKERMLPLQACSSGLQSVLPLIMVIDYALRLKCFDSFVIEEPEQNLYPSNQRELLLFLLSRFGELGNLILTTHSPYMLSCVNVAMLAQRIVKEFPDIQHEFVDAYKSISLDSDEVAVYALNQESETYCVNLKNEKTQLIGINSLDLVSDVIGDDFDRLYRLYMKLKRDGYDTKNRSNR